MQIGSFFLLFFHLLLFIPSVYDPRRTWRIPHQRCALLLAGCCQDTVRGSSKMNKWYVTPVKLLEEGEERERERKIVGDRRCKFQ